MSEQRSYWYAHHTGGSYGWQAALRDPATDRVFVINNFDFRSKTSCEEWIQRVVVGAKLADW